MGLPGDETKTERCLRLLAHLFREGRIRTRDAARLTGRDARGARTDLATLRSIVPLRSVGQGPATEWILDPPVAWRQLGPLDRLSLLVGQKITGFLHGTALYEGLERAVEGREAELERWSAHIDRKIRYLDEPARRFEGRGDALDDVIDAIFRERRLSFDYDGRDGVERVEGIAPLTLVIYRRGLYALALVEDKPRTYAIDRMGATSVEAPFDYPEDWLPDAWLTDWFGIAPEGPAGRVVLRFTAYAARYVRARRWHGSQRIVERDDGGVDLVMWTTGLELRRFALEWGEHCEVLEPPELREAVVRELKGALRRYEEAGP